MNDALLMRIRSASESHPEYFGSGLEVLPMHFQSTLKLILRSASSDDKWIFCEFDLFLKLNIVSFT